MSVNKRTTYKPVKEEIIKYAAQMANQVNMLSGHDAAVKFIQRCFVAVKGDERRKLEPGEAAKLIGRI
jgi:hypothetical protein